jgi:hypothetical protein
MFDKQLVCALPKKEDHAMRAFIYPNERNRFERFIPSNAVLRNSAAVVLTAASLLLFTGFFSARPAEGAKPLAVLNAKTGKQAVEPAGKAVIGLRGLSVERHYGFLTVRGEAANLTKNRLLRTEAIVELFDAGGKLLNVETALLELPNLQSGEESPFTVQTADNTDVVTYRVRFRQLAGPTLPSTTSP